MKVLRVMKRSCWRIELHLAVAMTVAGVGVASAAEPVTFNRDIRPILSDKCFACHGPDKAQRKTELRFDNEEGAFIDLKSGGKAIVPGDVEKSVLFQRLTSENDVLRMPPGYLGQDRLSDEEIDLIRRWIEQGAKWETHWAFIAPRRETSPAVSNPDWAQVGLDKFVAARLEKEGLKPTSKADRRALIRRVSLDITGVPPTPAEVEDFVNDTSPKAYEKVVDRLLVSPRYGERMAIRWLDAARYADTNGYQSDGYRHMWRWRDWVIDAFNDNKPFDEFTIEQIAGDLLPTPRRDQVIATGFNRNHRTSAEGGLVEEEFRVEYVSDRVETTSTVWLGLTVGCARCHDHKYDPLLQKEFYQLFAFFNHLPERGLVYNFGNEEPLIQAPTPEDETKLAALDKEQAAVEKAWKKLDGKINKTQRSWEKWVRTSGAPDWAPGDGLILHFPLDGNLREETGVYRRPVSHNPLTNPNPDPPVRPFVVEEEEDEDEGGTLSFDKGPLGQAARFDGKKHVEGGPGFEFSFLDPFTFSAWIYPTSPNGAILSKTKPLPKEAGHGLYLREGKVFLYINNRWTDISLRLYGDKPVEMNRWHHVAVTYDGGRKARGVHLYVNGKEQGKEIDWNDLIFPFGSDEPFRIGAGGGEPNFQGLIDDVRVYNRALPPEEAKLLPVRATVTEIARKKASKRTTLEAGKLRAAFLDRAAPAEIATARKRLYDTRRERNLFYAGIPTVMVMMDTEKPRQAYILARGSYEAHGDKVDPGTPAILSPFKPEWERNRLGLARWLVDRSNPLTARVTVNRFWQMFFGVGLVKTTENFGSQGEKPPHQDVLDWLAVEFMENGWDVKGIVKTIVTSATYRQSSKVTPELVERDPENRLFARGPRFRLPAETIRDQALAISGLLNEELGGPSVKPYQPEGLWKELTFAENGYTPDKGDDLYRRSLYTFWRRTVAPPSMVIFDSTDRETCAVREVRTNTPLQALNLMNDVTYVEASRKLGERMMNEGGETPAERIAYGFTLATARPPRSQESDVLHRVYSSFLDDFQTDPEAAEELLTEGESERDESLDAVELASYSSVASLILNLDETITKE